MTRIKKTRENLASLLKKHGFEYVGEGGRLVVGVPRPFEKEARDGNPPIRISLTPQNRGYKLSIYPVPPNETNRQYFLHNTITEVYKTVEKYLKNT